MDEQLKAALAELQKNLAEANTLKAKELIEAQIKTLVEASATKTAALEKEIAEIKAAGVTRDEADKKNQKALDDLIAKGGVSADSKSETFEEKIVKTLTEHTDEIAKFLRKETSSNRLTIEMKDTSTANVTGGSRYGQQFSTRGIIESAKRKVHVRDLLNVISAGPGNTYTYMYENGTGSGTEIAPAAEGATKSQFDLNLAEATVNFEVIAGWTRITNKALNNIPGMIGFLGSRLPEKLKRVEDAQLLYGNGSTPSLKGLGTSGNFTPASTATTSMELALIDALSQLEDQNEENATGILVRPAALYNFFKNQSAGSGEFDLPKNFVFVGNQLYISGVPVFGSTAVNYGDYFVADWSTWADLMVQDAMKIQFFEQDGTNVRENKMTVRIEETVALPVYGSRFGIKGNDATQS